MEAAQLHDVDPRPGARSWMGALLAIQGAPLDKPTNLRDHGTMKRLEQVLPKNTAVCPIHHIPLVERGGLTGKLCEICKTRHLSFRNKSGICVDCQRRLHLQAGESKGQRLTCPACMGSIRTERRAKASAANGKLGGPPMSKRLCRACGKNLLATRNESGVCRECQRIHGTPKNHVKAEASHKPDAIAGRSSRMTSERKAVTARMSEPPPAAEEVARTAATETKTETTTPATEETATTTATETKTVPLTREQTAELEALNAATLEVERCETALATARANIAKLKKVRSVRRWTRAENRSAPGKKRGSPALHAAPLRWPKRNRLNLLATTLAREGWQDHRRAHQHPLFPVA